jgi:TPR repeat protein
LAHLVAPLIFGAGCLLVACGKRTASVEDDLSIPKPSQSGIQIVNSFVSCDDIASCASACDAGSSDQCMLLATSYEFGNHAAKDQTHATALFVQACEMKNAPACVSAGQMYEYSHGVTKDDARAAGFYKTACDMGYEAGCANYAIMLERGTGVGKDIEAAKIIFERSCKKGAGLACDRLKAIGGAAIDAGAH